MGPGPQQELTAVCREQSASDADPVREGNRNREQLASGPHAPEEFPDTLFAERHGVAAPHKHFAELVVVLRDEALLLFDASHQSELCRPADVTTRAILERGKAAIGLAGIEAGAGGGGRVAAETPETARPAAA